MTSQQLSDAEKEALLFRVRQPAIAMLHTPTAQDVGTPGCWFGGEPTLPDHIEWPNYTYPYPPFEGLTVPMHFLAQINLQYAPRVSGLPQLPPAGTFFVFFEPVIAQMPPNRPGDVPCAHLGKASRVIYLPDDVSECPSRKPPVFPEIPTAAEELGGFHPDRYYPRWAFDFAVVHTYGSPERAVELDYFDKYLKISEIQHRKLQEINGWNRYKEVRDIVLQGSDHEPFHTIFGASREKLFQSRNCLDRTGHNHYPSLGDDDILLFRFGPDRNIGHYFSFEERGAGFWIKKSDLRLECFDNVTVWGDYF